MKRSVLAAVLVATILGSSPGDLGAQTSHFNDSLLTRIRRAASSMPGAAPTAIRVLQLNPSRRTIASMVEGGSSDSVTISYPVFQLTTTSNGWVVVDAGVDRQFVQNSPTFSDSDYAQVQLALRDARTIVATHEHPDHVVGVIRSPYLAEVQGHTLLTRAQVATLIAKPLDPTVKLDSATASRYRVTDYDALLPIAPGIVLIKAPGHTPGSQMVYVRTTSGQELILAGDVAWNMAGISPPRQKPAAVIRNLSEDRSELQAELEWLNGVASNVPVLVSHDAARIAELVSQGVLTPGFDLNKP